MEDQGEQRRSIEIDGVRVVEVTRPAAYVLALYTNPHDFPHLDKVIKEVAQDFDRPEEPLAFISYYAPPPRAAEGQTPQAHLVNTNTWKLDIRHLTWDAGSERIAVSAGEARALVRQVMCEKIGYFRKLDKAAISGPAKAGR